MFSTKTQNIVRKISKISKISKFEKSQNRILRFSRFFEKHIFCFVQEHIEKIKIFKIKIYFSKLLILNRYVSNLQVPTTSESPWGKVNVSKFMDFAEICRGTEKTPDFIDFGTIKKNNCYKN